MKYKLLSWASLILLPILIGLAYNIISPFGVKLFQNVNSGKLNQNVIKEINSAKAYEMSQNTDLIFIDARDQWEFSKQRISGSINIPEFSFDSSSPVVNSLNKNSKYIIYCSSEDCNISFKLARELQKVKYKNLSIMKDGIEGWRKNNFPTEGCGL